jgi:DNA end-binding protein Ku
MLSPEGTPLARRYFTTRDDKVLEWDDIVRGYEIAKDEFVVVDDDDLERLAPERTRDIDLRAFVPQAQVNPLHFERAYFLLPANESVKAYRLLAKAMESEEVAGIATFVMRGKEYLVAIVPEDGILRAETLRFADEIRTPESIGLPKPVKPKPAAIQRMSAQIQKLSKAKLATSELEDPAAERLEKLVKKKVRAGEDVVHYDPELDEQSTDVLDLVAMLRRSLESGGTSTKGSRSRSSKRSTGSSRKRPPSTRSKATRSASTKRAPSKRPAKSRTTKSRKSA